MKVILLSAIGLICTTYASAQKKFRYVYPDGMPGYVRASVKEQSDKGKVLYRENCGQCHNLGKRKNIVPDFDPGFLAKYELRMSNAEHESAMPETRVTAEELTQITMFLTYKKKGGHPFVPKQSH